MSSVSLGNNVELSVTVEAVSWVVLSSLVGLFVLDVSYIPVLGHVLGHNNVLFVLDSDVHSSFVLEFISNVLEHLEPSSVCFPDLHVG
jgi:hypothetical protein